MSNQVSVAPNAAANKSFLTVVGDIAKVYPEANLAAALARATRNKIPYTRVGDNINCTNLQNLTTIYSYLFATPQIPVFISKSTLLKPINKIVTFQVNFLTVQALSLCEWVNGKLVEGNSGIRYYVPVFVSFDASADLVFNAVRVASISY